MQRIIVLLFVLLTLALSAHAESRYVTDQLLVALRPAQNDSAPPLEYLETGKRVEVLADLGPFLKVKSASGAVGFARSKYFITTPPAKATAATADFAGATDGSAATECRAERRGSTAQIHTDRPRQNRGVTGTGKESR